MLGWWIIIKAVETPMVYDAPSTDTTGLLVRWDVGVRGLEWIEALIAEGKAREIITDLVGHHRYTLLAKDLIPILLDKIQNIESKSLGDAEYPFGGWLSNVTVHRQKISECPGNREIIIDAWDLS
ncbi:MAG: hypothetical protein LBU46_00040 [Candidatus Accumulibacter sp.]|jgi:hypothetical protein|nr:hypothetical protein [Accumulibacter sp.]